VIKRIEALYRRLNIEPYWYLILPLLLVAVLLFVNHLATGATPSRVFLHIAALNFDIYWYGICIMGGIALGTYVVSRLVQQRGVDLFHQTVPESLKERTLPGLNLPKAIIAKLARRNVAKMGDLLFLWGLDPRNLGLNRAETRKLGGRLAKDAHVPPDWIGDAPWRVWNPDHAWSGLAWCLILGLIGARLYHVLTPSPSMAAVGINSPLDYFNNLDQLINLRNGGLGIYGGIAGGALGLFWFTRRQRLPGLAWADLAAIGVALGQVFGRWGNFFNQELYGSPTDLPWGINIEPRFLLPGLSPEQQYHPAFLYESIWSLLTFVVLLVLHRRTPQRLITGDLTAIYLVFYAIGRILLETVRLDSRPLTIGDLSLDMAVATFVSIVVAVVMVAWRMLVRRRAR
jgi:phosphatidylglycerol:prolipoprotein diacylglycerol transferase